MIDRYRRLSERRSQSDEGFTLIELLIVIAVLGILAAVTVFGLAGVGGQSLTAACHADAKSVAVAQEAYRSANGVFYPDVPGTPNPATIVVSAASGAASPATGLATYLRTPPGNITKYVISTKNTGAVLVDNKTTGAIGVDSEKFAQGATPLPDPCLGL